jgi:hypothetical protein
MRTIEQYEQENENLYADMKTYPHLSQSEKKRRDKLIKINNKCIEALRRGVTKQYLEEELTRAINRKEYIDDEERYQEWKYNTPGTEHMKDPKREYQKSMERSKTTKQITFLEYMLK